MPSDREAGRIQCWAYRDIAGWQQSSTRDFLDVVSDDVSGDPVPLCIYVHENRVTAEEAFSRGCTISRQLQRTATQLDGRFRLLVISWPSDRIGIRPRPDTQIKAQRSEMHGYYLAWLLDQLDPRVPVTLFGHSYGPRLITSALHLLGGGTIAGYQLPARIHPTRPGVRVALFASALDADWLSPHHHHGQALTQVEQMLVAYNPWDPVLHWYPHLHGRGGPPALGYVGLSTSSLGPDCSKVQQINVSGSVGKTHDWQSYEGSTELMSRIGPYLIRKTDHVN